MKKFYSNENEKKKKLDMINNEIDNKLKELPSDSTRKLNLSIYISLACVIVFTIIYFISSIHYSFEIEKQIETIISTTIICLFSISFIVIGLFLDFKKKRIAVIIGSIIFCLYFIFQILVQNSIINLSKQSTIPNFYDKEITEVVKWAEENNILVEQTYENSDSFKLYHIISQDVKPGTLTKKIKKIKVVVSDGPEENKETLIPDMIGWTTDEVIKFVNKNFLTNLNISFEFNDDVQKDIVFGQINESPKMLRNSKIDLKISLGTEKDIQAISMKNLVGLNTFSATTWLGRNNIKYEIQYGYSDKYDEGTVIKQSITKGKIIDKERTKIVIITIAMKNKITVPDLTKLSLSEITTWATENKLKVEFKEEYDDTIEKGKFISSNKAKGNILNTGDTIQVTISKGQIKMIKFTNIDDFRKWATENDITYNISFEFNEKVKAGNIISSSHNENEVIKNEDTVNLVISQGGTVTVPNFIDKTKSEATTLCKENNLKCNFEGNGNKVNNQSMRLGSTVPINTSITLNLN